MRFSPGSRLGPYELVAPLGAGGMGEVYRAIDRRLGRAVAIKILTERLTENRRATARFEREARAVAALTHPNILSIYEFEVDGPTPFVVTELLEGQTLRERMATRIPWKKAAEIGASIADGLAAAHARGITHRDLKPENVFLTSDGRVKILDFGIAHMREGGGDGARFPTDTEPTAEFRADAPLGTVGYVAPEQIRMEEPAPTSDLFAMGVILHEMIGGANPFARASSMETLAAILDEEPVPLRHAAADVPIAIDHIVHRCLEKNPEERFQSARDLAAQLRECARESPQRAARPRALRPALGMAAAAIAIAAGAFLYLNDRPSFALGRAGATQGVTAVAILPLANATGDPNLDYVTDGITESIINQLSELPSLRVTARPTVFQLKGEETDLREIGKRLAVRVIATGKVAMHGETLTVQADLIDASSGAQMWGATFDAPRKETASLSGRLAGQIARELEQKLTRPQRSRFASAQETDPAAFDLYLRGREALNSETPSGRERAITLLGEAVAADPRFARAHAALGEAYVRYSTTAEPRLMFARARESIARALALDPELAEAHLSLGVVLLWADWDFAGAEREFRRALALNPSLAAANAYYSDLLECVGKYDEAIHQALRARTLDPLSRRTAMALAAAYFYAGRYDDARAELARLLRTDAGYPNAHVMMGRVFHVTGDGANACRAYVRWDELREAPADQVAALRAACASGGVEGYNRQLIRILTADPASDPMMIAGVYAELGETDQALRYLETGLNERVTNMIYVRSDPAFASLRTDPAFVSILKKIGFPRSSLPNSAASAK